MSINFVYNGQPNTISNIGPINFGLVNVKLENGIFHLSGTTMKDANVTKNKKIESAFGSDAHLSATILGTPLSSKKSKQIVERTDRYGKYLDASFHGGATAVCTPEFFPSVGTELLVKLSTSESSVYGAFSDHAMGCSIKHDRVRGEGYFWIERKEKRSRKNAKTI